MSINKCKFSVLSLRSSIKGCSLLLLFLCGLLVGCAHKAPPTLHTLDVVPYGVAHRASNHLTLLVLPTQANTEFATMQIAYVKYLHQLNYFAKHQWVAPPTQMIPPLLVKALQASKHFHAVVGPGSPGTPDLYLSTQILEMQQEFLSHPSKVRVSINAALIQASTGRIIAARRFTSVVPAPAENPDGGVFAFNEAMTWIQAEIVKFCVTFT